MCALALAPALMLTAPVAQADEVQYLNQVASKVSVVVEPSRALSLGNTVCQTVRSAMANGMSLGQGARSSRPGGRMGSAEDGFGSQRG